MNSRLSILLACCLVASCGLLKPRVVHDVYTQVVYRDREIHDTATVEIPYYIEKNVTRDTTSHLENPYAKSDASVKDGFLWHSLESVPQAIEVPVVVHVTDTLYKESAVYTETVKVEKPLSRWQKFRLRSFWWLILLAIIGFRREIIALIKKII